MGPTGSRLSNSPVSPMNERAKTEVGKARLMVEQLKSYVRHVEHTQRPMLEILREQLAGNEERKQEILRELEENKRLKRQELDVIKEQKEQKISEKNDAQLKFDEIKGQVDSLKTIRKNEEEVHRLRQLVEQRRTRLNDLTIENGALDDYVTAQRGACCLRPKTAKPPGKARPASTGSTTLAASSSVGMTYDTPPQMKQPTKETSPDVTRAGVAVGGGSLYADSQQHVQQIGLSGRSCDTDADLHCTAYDAAGSAQGLVPSATSTGGMARHPVELDSNEVPAPAGGIAQPSAYVPAFAYVPHMPGGPTSTQQVGTPGSVDGKYSMGSSSSSSDNKKEFSSRSQNKKDVTGKNDFGDCCVCMDRGKAHALVPCGHLCACAECAVRLVKKKLPCPVCRGSIERSVHIYV